MGYARVSTGEQRLTLQQDALKAAGCRRVFRDEGMSGAVAARPGLRPALKHLKPGDVLVVWKLDRLGRSLAHLLQVVADLERRGVGFRSLSEAVDTTTASGKLFFHIMGALAEFERALIRERTVAGMEAARKRGVTMGRPRKLTLSQIADARGMMADGAAPDAIATRFGVSLKTLSRALRRRQAHTPRPAKVAATAA